MTTPRPLAERVERDIRAVIEEAARPLSVSELSVEARIDEEGEEIVAIDVWHPLNDAPVDTRQMLRMQFAVSRWLQSHGEERFAYLRQHFTEGQSFGSAA